MNDRWKGRESRGTTSMLGNWDIMDRDEVEDESCHPSSHGHLRARRAKSELKMNDLSLLRGKVQCRNKDKGWDER